MNEPIHVSIWPGQDGGLAIYEQIEGDNVLVFCGDLDAYTKYMGSRGAKIIVAPETSDRNVKSAKPVKVESPSNKVYSLKEVTAETLLEQLPKR